MYKKYLVTLILTSICQVFIGQVDFYQDNNIIVSKNNMELNNAWAGGMNFCQFSKIDLNLDGYDDLFIFDRSGKNGTVNGNKIIPFVFDNNLNEYIYSPSYINLFPDLQDWVLLVDYNQDNKVDIFTSSNSSIAVYTNTSENIMKPILWLCWLFFVSVILNEMIELTKIPELFSYVSAFSLAFAHTYNLRYCQCEDGECCND